VSALQLDHLVVAARSLDEGVRWCEATLGITPGPGGRHPLMGTHNRLCRIAGEAFPDAYLEIIALDPEAAPPGRARWFGLDAIDLAGGPRLIHWVARTEAIDAALGALREQGLDAGRAVAASRDTPSGRLSWRIAVRDDGALLAGGALPTLIEWDSSHPARAMPDAGLVLRTLTLRGLPPSATDALDLAPVTLAEDDGPALSALLDTPRGAVRLDSQG
jgi:hypothetical protein